MPSFVWRRAELGASPRRSTCDVSRVDSTDGPEILYGAGPGAGGGHHPRGAPGSRGSSPAYAVARAQPSCLTTRTVDAGYFSSFSAGRIGRETSSPLQFGQRPPSVVSVQSRQKVHSKLQIMASAASGGRSLLQHSQFGLSSSILVSPDGQRLGMVRPRGGLVTDCRVVLRALAPIEHAVVPDDAHNTMAQLIGAGAHGRREPLSRAPIPPRSQQ